MKKTFLAIAVIFIFSNLVNAQKFSLGPELGANLIMLDNEEVGRNYHLCWFDGINAEYKFYDMFSLRSGIYFSHRKKMYQSADTSEFTVFGFSPSDLGIPGVDFNVYSKTRGVVSQFGLEMPLFACFNLKEFSVFAGPYMNFMVGAWKKEETDTRIPFLQAINIDSIDQSGIVGSLFPSGETHDFIESSLSEDYRVFDFGFKAGMSYTADRFRLNMYYTLGIPDYRVDRGTDEVNRHSYFTMSVAYNFGIGRSGGASSFGN
jgi:hypothetical protein